MDAIADDDAVRAMLVAVERLGSPGEWHAPEGYPSVGLALIDAVWSIGVRWESARNVIARYRAERLSAGHDPDGDGPRQVREFIEACGGPERFAELVRNSQRTSSRNGILKAEAVLREARILEDEGVTAPADLLSATMERLEHLSRRWSTIPGQGSGVSWRAFSMLVGLPEVKPDRMIRRFVADALGRPSEAAVNLEEARELVLTTAERLGTSPRTLDHAIWAHQSRLSRPRRGSL